MVRRLKEGGECAFRRANLPTKFQMPDSVDNPSVSCPVGWGISPLWLTNPRTSRGKSWVRFIPPRAVPWVEKRHRGLKCWQNRCLTFGPWCLGWAMWKVKTDAVHFQGKSGSLHALGSHKANYQEPELREDWQLKLMTMPWPLTGWLVGLLTERANRVINTKKSLGRSTCFFNPSENQFQPRGALWPQLVNACLSRM